MEKLPALTPSQFSMPSLTRPSAGKDAGRTATKRILSSYPDYGKAPPDYLVAMAECLAGLTTEEFSVVTNPSTGIATVSRFLPCVADIHEFLRKEQARHEQFKPHTHYRRLEPFDVEQPPLERRKQVVMETLGYNPQDRKSKRMESEYAMPLDPKMVEAVTASFEAAQDSKRTSLMRKTG